MEAIGQLTGGIAHDFNNILTSAMGYIGLAAERPAASADAKLDGYLEQARKSCRRARDLIQQMLTFSRGGSGASAPVHLPALLADSAKLLRSTLPATVSLDVAAPDGLPPVMGDSVQIEQILLNLCINARDAMGGVGVAGGEKARINGGGVCESNVECRGPVSAAARDVRLRGSERRVVVAGGWCGGRDIVAQEPHDVLAVEQPDAAAQDVEPLVGGQRLSG
jgi:signal transduction histidine kinase